MSARPTDDQPKVARIWTNAVWLGAIPLLLNVISVASAGFIARMLGTQEFGRFSVGSSLVALTAPIADFGLRALAVRQLARSGPGIKRALGDLIVLRVVLAIGATIVAIGVALVVSATSGLRPVILVMAVTVIPVTVAGTLSDGLMARDRAPAISGSAFWSGLLLTAASVVAAGVWRSATALAVAYVVGPVVNMALLAWHSRREHGSIPLGWRPTRWRVLLRRAIPFFRIGILSVVITRVDTVVVGGLFGQGMAGVYAAACSLTDRLSILVDSVASATLPALARLRAEPQRVGDLLGRVMYPLAAILAAGALVSAPAATAVITVIFGPAYAVGGPVLAVGLLLLPLAAIDAMLGEGLLAMRRDHFVARTGVVNQVVTLVALPLFSLAAGMVGARGSRVAGTLVSLGPRFRESRMLFDGLWNRTQIRQLIVSILGIIPAVVVLAMIHLTPLTETTMAIAAFAAWCVVIAGFSGAVPRLRELYAQRYGGRP